MNSCGIYYYLLILQADATNILFVNILFSLYQSGMFSLSKQQIVRLVISFFAIAALLYVIFTFYRFPFGDIDPLEAVPEDAPLILQIRQPEITARNLQKTAYQQLTDSVFLCRRWQEDYPLIRQLFRKAGQSELFEKNTLTAALEVNGSDDANYLFIIDNRKNATNARKLAGTYGFDKVKEYIFQDVTIFKISLPGGRELYLSAYRNLLLMGRYSLLTEDGISQLLKVRSNIFRKSGFREVKQDGDVQCYLNLQNAGFLFSTFVTPERLATLDNFRLFAQWIGFNLQFTSKGIALSGKLDPNLSNPFVHALANERAVSESKIADVLPDNTALLLHMNIDHFPDFLSEVGAPGQANVRKYLLPWMSEEAAFVIMEPYSTSIQTEQFAVFRTQDARLTHKCLLAYGQKAGLLTETLYQTYPIRQIQSDDLLRAFFGEQWCSFHNPFYTIIGDYVVFANSQTALEVWIDKYLVGQYLSNDPDYQLSGKPYLGKSQAFCYLSMGRLAQLLRSFIRPDLAESFEREFTWYQQAGLASFGFRSTGPSFEVHGKLLHGQTIQRKAQTSILWKTLLTANAAIPPALVLNPDNKQQEIFIQDEDNQVYLISNAGEILMKRHIPERIQSGIFQIDYYKTGELYFLFNTQNGIYLLDRKGQDVHDYPIPLQSKATNGMVAIDFDHARVYQYFVACENGNIYGFDQSGRPVPGWNPQPGVGIVHLPLSHFQSGGMDFVMALNSEGVLHTFKRDGSRRFNAIALNGHFGNAICYQEYEPNPRIVIVDSTGHANNINLLGESFQLMVQPAGSKHVRFDYADLGGDARKDYLSVNDSVLICHYYNGPSIQRLYTRTFGEGLSDVFGVGLVGHAKMLAGAVGRSGKRIYLLTEKGEMYPDFPLAGSTRFSVSDLFGDQSNVLIVGYENSVYAYKLK